eukprot:SAG11_NODE_31721_length_289_cov_1.963158_1_plen_41_part_01
MCTQIESKFEFKFEFKFSPIYNRQGRYTLSEPCAGRTRSGG